MDGTMEVGALEVTTPAEPTTEDGNEQLPDTTAETPETDDGQDTTPAVAPDTDGAAQQPADEATAPTVAVRYNHEDRELSMEEARNYAQMGLRYESMTPMLDKLRMMAAGRGQSLAEFVDAWSAADQRATLEQYMQKTGGDRETAEKLMRMEQAERRAACEERDRQDQKADEDARTAVTSRLASEFVELQGEFPEITTIEGVPDAVIRDATKNGRHLLDAYLRYQRAESKKIERNTAATAQAAGASVGSQTDAPPSGDKDSATEAMLRGVHSVFG